MSIAPDLSDLIYSTGTVSIDTGQDALVGVGTSWEVSEAAPVIRPGDMFVALGYQVPIYEVLDDTHIVLSMPWAGGNLAGAAYQIIKGSPYRQNNVDVAVSIRNFVQSLAGTAVIFYVTGSVPDPDLGEDGQYAIKLDEAPWRFWRKQDDVWVSVGSIVQTGDVREKLAANRTYYVRADGSDLNDGLANTSGGAFLTVQKALEVIQKTIDLAGFVATIQIVDGTYNGSFGGEAPQVGALGPSSIIIKGNAANPGNVILNGTEGPTGTAYASGGCQFTIQDCEIRNTGSVSYGHGLYARWGGVIYYSNIRFGSANGAQLTVSFNGTIRAIGNYSIVNGANGHFHAHAGTIRCEGVTVALSGTPNFSNEFANANGFGTLFAGGATFSGSATGRKFLVNNGYIGSSGLSLNHFPGDITGQVINGGNYAGILLGIRDRLNANRTYYVHASSGSDTNNGLSLGAAFATIQKAVNIAYDTLDLNGYNVTIQLADGTFTVGATRSAPQVGVGTISIAGNAITPANVLMSGSAALFNFIGGARVLIKDMKVTTSASSALVATFGAQIDFTNIEFGSVVSNHIFASDQGIVRAMGNYAISGGATNHWSCNTGGIIRVQNRTITITNTPAFSNAFAFSQIVGLQTVSGNTYSGSATGVRYKIDTNGVIFSNGGTLPGDSVGTIATGGQYV